MNTIDLYFDFVSPYSYLAFSQRDVIAEATGARVMLRPVSVAAIMQATKNAPTSLTCPPKRAYALGDVMRWAKRYGVRIVPHPRFGRFSTEPLLLGAVAAIDAGVGDAFCDAAFKAIWQEGANVEDDDAMADYFGERVPDGMAIWQGRAVSVDGLAANATSAVDAGAFGVPTFVTPAGIFFGNDRIDFLIEALAA